MARAVAVADVEAQPEADRLNDFPHPRETPVLLGQDAALMQLRAAFAGGRPHHAWLVTGPVGIGKATLSYHFARLALARTEDRDMFGQGNAIEPGSPTDRQIRALSHPSLLLIRRTYDTKTKRFSQTIPVDEVRRLKGFLALTPEGEGSRVVIVDRADDLNPNAANALLKSLEEPPARTIFLLLSSAPGRLLPTIRSRCRSIAANLLSDADVKRAASQALTAAGKAIPEAHEWNALYPLAGGSVGRALALIGGGGLALQTRIDTILKALPKLDLKSVHALGDELQSAVQDAKFQLFFDLFFARLARLIDSAATNTGAEADRALAERLIGAKRLATFAELWETLVRDKAEAMSLNLDRKSLILGVFARLEAASRA